MTPEERLRKLTGPDGGMRVPEGYFPEVVQRIGASLPEHPMLHAEQPERTSWWLKAKPILYMAAMFAGIWLMMKVFTTVQSAPQISVDNPPVVVAEALKNPDNMHQVVSGISSDETGMMDEMMDEYDGDFSSFAEDFYETN